MRVELALGRKLHKDEDVHHINGDKTDFRFVNLLVTGHDLHGWVSTKQHWFMNLKQDKERAEWEGYFGPESTVEDAELAFP